MQVRKHESTQKWRAQIWYRGKKYSFTSDCTNKREAQKDAERYRDEELIPTLNKERKAGGSLELGDVIARYMIDVGDRHTGADNTDRQCRLLVKFFGASKIITDITHDDALALRRWRRQHTVGKHAPRPISAFAVNDTTEQLKKLFTYLRPTKIEFQTEPAWKALWLDVPKARPRQLIGDEAQRLDTAVLQERPDYRPLLEFMQTVGKRKTNCFTLEWDQVEWGDANVPGEITMLAKGRAGGKIITITMTPAIRAILWPLYQARETNAGVPAATKRVFTFVAERTVDKIIRGRRYQFVKGKRYPITRDSLRRVWGTIRKAAGIPTHGAKRLRLHDLRHDFASRLLRTVNGPLGVKVLQDALDHADINTTLTTYSHLLESDVADAIEALAQERRKNRPQNRPRLIAKGTKRS